MDVYYADTAKRQLKKLDHHIQEGLYLPALMVYDSRVWFVEWEGVMTRRFKIGEIVFLRPSLSQNAPAGAYVVIKRLPEYHGEFEYRVRNSYELHERVVRENELRKAS